jgi:hypothetical protein
MRATWALPSLLLFLAFSSSFCKASASASTKQDKVGHLRSVHTVPVNFLQISRSMIMLAKPAGLQ